MDDAVGSRHASESTHQNTPPNDLAMVRLSILIKTLNEEAKIGDCLTSVNEACARLGDAFDVEIVVADSLSSDRTIEIAAQHGAKIVQLASPSDRGCGAGVQLGYQYASGEFIMFMDGDMELDPEFLPVALKRLSEDPKLAGVAGICEDTQVRNWFDRRRIRVRRAQKSPEVQALSGGGLYRRNAIENAGGYAADRNLRAFEEAELGMRLTSHGWRLERLSCVSVRHTGHATSTVGLIRRDWRTGRMDSAGILLRHSFGTPWFWAALRLFLHPVGVLIFWAFAAVALSILPAGVAVTGLALVGCAALSGLAILRRSVIDAAFSLVLWHLAAVGLVRGLLSPKLSPPDQPLRSRVLYAGSVPPSKQSCC